MLRIRAPHIEHDLMTTGVVETFGSVLEAVEAMKFTDRTAGIYCSQGGLIGTGDILVDRYSTTELKLRLSSADFINYEHAITGRVVLSSGDREFQTSAGRSTVGDQSGFAMAFDPQSLRMEGLQIAIMLRSIDAFLARADEQRLGSVEMMEVGQQGKATYEQALLSFADHVLENFALYRMGNPSSQSRLGQALIVEIFVQFLLDVGALKLKIAPTGFQARSISRAVEFMEASYAEPLSMAEVAATAGVTLRNLQTGFRKMYNMTPRQYLGMIRLEKARILLQSHSITSVADAALSCGIMHLGRFSQFYRNRYGELPSETLRGTGAREH